MKNSILAGLLLTSTIVVAQEQPKTLFNNNSVKSWGFVVGADMQNGQMYDESVWFSGIRAGAVINQSWTIGGVFGQSLNEISPNLNTTSLPIYDEFDFSYYGAFIEYSIKPNNLVHLSFPLNFGVFDSDFDSRDELFADYDDAERFSFFVEPGVNLEINIHKYVRFYTGVSYRFQPGDLYTEGINIPKAEDQFLLNVGIKIGIFDFK